MKNILKKPLSTIASLFSMMQFSTLFISQLELKLKNAKKNLGALFLQAILMIAFLITTIFTLSIFLIIYLINNNIGLLTASFLIFVLNMLGLSIFTFVVKTRY